MVGGYAVAAHKIQRMTFDIDFLMTAEDFAKIETELFSAGYSLLSRQKEFIQLKSNNPVQRDLDFLIADPFTVKGLLAQGQAVTIAGENFIIPSPLHLIAMKLHSIAENPKRELKDLSDVIQLMRTYNINGRSDEVRELFLKYKSIGLLDRVIQSLD